jgi:two-component sensor histidine kinase
MADDAVRPIITENGDALQKLIWPFHAGEMADRIRTFAWEVTPIGAIESWPRALRAAIDIMLPCGFPMVIMWGPHLVQIYNDRARPLYGNKEARALGQATHDCWPEVRHINEPILESVWAGETRTFEDALYPILRSSVVEDAWFTLTYSPLYDDARNVGGILLTMFETTAGKLAARRRDEVELELRSKSRHQDYVLALSDALRGTKDPAVIPNIAADFLGQFLGGCRVAISEIYGSEVSAPQVRSYVGGVPRNESLYQYEDHGEDLIRELRAGHPIAHSDIANDPNLSDETKSTHAAAQVGAILRVPILQSGTLVAILEVRYAGPHDFQPDEIALATETAERTWVAVVLARAKASLRESERRLKVVAEELKHRTRNVLTIAQGIAKQTFHYSESVDDFEVKILGRFSALASAQELISGTEGGEVSLRNLIVGNLHTLGGRDAVGLVDISGPDVILQSSVVQTFALLIHELATNATKYGALSGRGGRLSIRWSIEASRLGLIWSETGLTISPDRIGKRGYGRSLIENALPFAFGGVSQYLFTSDGIQCSLSIPMKRVVVPVK